MRRFSKYLIILSLVLAAALSLGSCQAVLDAVLPREVLEHLRAKGFLFLLVSGVKFRCYESFFH